MRDYVLKTNALTKEYKKSKALDNISLNIEKGKIYGFIGQNGAGKTTLMRLIMGLTPKTKGELELFGSNIESEIVNQRKRIGCIIETPSFYPDMTAYQNLEVQRIGRGIPDKSCIGKVLEIVNLKDTGKKTVKDFSLGMKQRLAIANALLSQPEFLILDEPINGLDPISIIEIRELLKKLNEEKQITILISSHILGELYQLVTDYIFIHNGKIFEELTLRQLDEKCKKHISFAVNNTEIATTVLEQELKTTNYKVMPNNIIKLYDYVDNVEKVSNALQKNNLILTQIGVNGDSLENYFVELVGGASHV